MPGIFDNGPNYNLNACVGNNGGPYTFYQYSLGYFESANIIVEQLFTDNHHIDLKIYPIVFMYRQYIELMLKHLSLIATNLFEDCARYSKGHDLFKRWEDLLKVIEKESDLELEEIDFSEISSLIREFNNLDPTGETFRYPTSKKGEYFLQEISVINIEVLYKKMKIIYEIFENIDLRLSVLKEWIYDARNY